MMKKIVVFTGAGVSAESGIKTFRDSGGLWEEYDINEVATPQAWNKNKELVLEFYNKRRKQIIETSPNIAHYVLTELQKEFDVHIITQNIDDLHERAGSKKVLHLHGEIMKCRSTLDENLILPVKNGEIKLGDKCPKGSQLRPHIVWFGEMVPEMEKAYQIVSTADIFIIVGTSLNVYPAAGLVDFAPANIPVYLIDPNDTSIGSAHNVTIIKEKASTGVSRLAKELLSKVSIG